MLYNLDKGRALCPQICEQICLQIALGEYQPNEKILSVRETAINAGVNPNTVQRAFESLEQSGILYSVRGSGWYVSEDTSLADQTLKAMVEDKTAAYFASMEALGYSIDAVKNLVKEWNA